MYSGDCFNSNTDYYTTNWMCQSYIMPKDSYGSTENNAYNAKLISLYLYILIPTYFHINVFTYFSIPIFPYLYSFPSLYFNISIFLYLGNSISYWAPIYGYYILILSMLYLSKKIHLQKTLLQYPYNLHKNNACVPTRISW